MIYNLVLYTVGIVVQLSLLLCNLMKNMAMLLYKNQQNLVYTSY